jgi:hypothetical protein
MRGLTRTSLVVATCVLVACGAPKRGDGGDDDGTTDGGTGGTDGDTATGCSDDAKLIYVVDSNHTLSQFDPTTKQFHDLGKLVCPAQGGATPFSMGIDRSAHAWVLYSSGELFQVDTASLACTKSTWTSQQGLVAFGMGFSTDVVGGTSDSLFVCGGSALGPAAGGTSKLATLSTTTLQATPVGDVQGWPELTGNANAELWGFFPDATAPKVARLDKGNGGAQQTFPLPELAGEPTAWAFAFYGGDYWIFLAKDLELSTTVYQMDGMTGAIKSMLPTGSRTIVGAGVSTCAPVIL